MRLASNLSCLQSNILYSTIWRHSLIFTSSTLSTMFNLLHPSSSATTYTFASIPTFVSSLSSISVIDITYQPSPDYDLLSWITTIASINQSTILLNSTLYFGILWIDSSYFPTVLWSACETIFSTTLPPSWCM